jgi:hypothetical protein
MPITINGTGTVTGINAGGLPDDCITTADIAANAVTYAKIGTTEQGQLCKAWVNFNGTSTVAIRASYNVSSITDNGAGNYTVNFANALTDANYCYSLSNRHQPGAFRGPIYGSSTTLPTSTALRVETYDLVAGGYTAQDVDFVCVAIFR